MVYYFDRKQFVTSEIKCFVKYVNLRRIKNKLSHGERIII